MHQPGKIKKTAEAAFVANQRIAGRYTSRQLLKSDSGGYSHIGEPDGAEQAVVIKTRMTESLPSGYLMRLEHETGLLSRLQSQHYNSPLEIINEPDAVHIVFPFVRGSSLERRLKTGPLSFEEAIQLGQNVLWALRDIHENRIVHRAVRPSNLILNSGHPIRNATLTDLGSAGPMLSNSLEPEQFWQDARYYSPEQSGAIDHDISPSSDLYSVGAVLFECLAGYSPFSGTDLHSVLFSHMTTTVPELRTLGLSIPRAFDEVVQRLLRKDPRDRYQSAEAALMDLAAIQAGLRNGEEEPKVVIGSCDLRSTLIEPAFVSRDTELAVFDERLEAVRSGHPGLVFLEGESGGGKSRLLSEVSHRAAKHGFRVLRGIARNDVAQRPFHILDGVVERFVSLCKLDENYANQVRNSLGQDADVVAASIPEIAELYGIPATTTAAPELTGEMRTIRALANFLTALGSVENPALIVMDDCQWADELTHKLIRHWQSQHAEETIAHTLLVAGFRSEEVDSSHPLRQIETSAHLQLSLFDQREIRQLAESMAGRLPEEALNIVEQLSGGSPFMASAVLHGLVESGALVHEQTHWRLEPMALGKIHSSDREASFLTRRLDLLSDAVLDFLTAGAVIGNEFDIHVASALADQEASDAILAMDVARQRQLIWSRPDGVTCIFMHDKIRRALLDRQSAERRKELHLRAAYYFERNRNRKISELAYHFDAAGASNLAFSHALEAAEQARARHALEAAEQQYRIARRGASSREPDVQYRVAEGLGDVLMLRGKYDAAGQLFGEAKEFAETRIAQAQIRGKLAELCFKRGDMEGTVEDNQAALRSLKRWIPCSQIVLVVWLLWEVLIQVLHTFFPKLLVHRRRSQPSEAERLTVRLFSGLAHGSWYCRGSLSTLWAHLRGLNLAERYPPTAELANAYSEHAPVMSLLGMFSRAIRYAEKSLTIRRELGDLWGQGQSLHYYGVVLYAASRYSECINRCRESVRLLERMGDYQQVHVARYQIAASYYRLGDLPMAIEESIKNRQSGLEVGDDQASGIVLDVWARAAQGDLSPELMNEELHRQRTDAQGQAQVVFAAGVCDLGQNRVQQATEHFEEAMRIVNQAGVSNTYTLPFQAWAATAYRRAAETLADYTPNRRGRLIRKAATAARRARLASWTCKNDLPHIFREQGLVFSVQGRAAAARKAFAKSLRIARQLNSRYEFAQTVMAQAKVGKEFGWELPSEELEEARSVFAELQVTNDLINTEQKLETAAPSLSLVDRFETVLESGRRIATGLSESVIYQETFTAACQLLRVHLGMILQVDADDKLSQGVALAGNLGGEMNLVLVEKSLAAGRAIASGDQADDAESAGRGSSLCAPLYMRGKAVACVYVTHPEIRGLFGEDEERLLDFLATIAGAALENAEGFAELQKLNATLERRVIERTAVVEARSRELATSNHELEKTAHELRQAQIQLSASKQAAEAASEAKSRFLATMSHEIRTPMNGILGMAELVLNSSLNDRQRGYLDTLKGSANALLTLLNDLLDFSKIEAGKMELESIAFSLRDVVIDSARLIAVPAGRKGLNLISHVEPDVPTQLVGDPNRLRQVIVNLIGNAIKFTTQGEVVVHVSVKTKSDRNVQLRLSVRDTGIGIPKSKQKSIFEAFHQTDSSVTRRFGGTGLGLAISTQLVGLMNGAIEVESEENQGTVFHVDIPFELPEQTDAALPDFLAPQRRRIELLADHEDCRASTKSMLAYLGLNIAEVEDSLTVQRFDDRGLLIVDLSVQSQHVMAAVTERIFEGGYDPAEIICLVPAGQIELLEECEALALEHILTKPVKPRELMKAIDQVIEKPAPGNSSVEPIAPKSDNCLKILVADDSPVNREVAIGMLELCGHQVEAVANGEEAIAALQDREFDLVFMDLEMPVMDGLAATHAIRCLPTSKSQVPIYAMTAHALSETDQKCQDAGMDGYITKPIVPDQLIELLNRVCTTT